MTKEERQSIILELLIQHNSILVTDLATHLNVSSVTIRKDLTDLEREKKLYRNHGKAILIDPYIDNRNVSRRKAVCQRKETDWNESRQPHHSQRFHIDSIGNNHARTCPQHRSGR